MKTILLRFDPRVTPQKSLEAFGRELPATILRGLSVLTREEAHLIADEMDMQVRYEPRLFVPGFAPVHVGLEALELPVCEHLRVAQNILSDPRLPVRDIVQGVESDNKEPLVTVEFS